jgi:hypothetical protein
MNTCLIHSQTYPQDGYCVYCGPPENRTVTFSGTFSLPTIDTIPTQSRERKLGDEDLPLQK